MNGNVIYTTQTHTWLKAYSATGNFGKKLLPTWPVRAALSKQRRDQSSSPLLLTNMGPCKQDRGEENILSFYRTHGIELTLPVPTTIPSQTPAEGKWWHTAQEPTCPLVTANCQNFCLNEDVQHLRILLEQLRPLTIHKGVWGFFSLPLVIFFFLFF